MRSATDFLASKREMVNLIIALLLDNLYKNSDIFIPNWGGELKLQCANIVCLCECESEFSTKTICVNNWNEDEFRFVTIVLICVFVRKANTAEKFRIEQIGRINL